MSKITCPQCHKKYAFKSRLRKKAYCPCCDYEIKITDYKICRYPRMLACPLAYFGGLYLGPILGKNWGIMKPWGILLLIVFLGLFYYFLERITIPYILNKK